MGIFRVGDKDLIDILDWENRAHICFTCGKEVEPPCWYWSGVEPHSIVLHFECAIKLGMNMIADCKPQIDAEETRRWRQRRKQ